MYNAGLVWVIFAPAVASLLSLLLLLLCRDSRVQKWVPARSLPLFDSVALFCVCLGLLAEGPLLYWNTGVSATMLGLRLAVQPLALFPLLASNVALLCAVFLAWETRVTPLVATEAKPPWAVLAPGSISALLALGLLADAPLVQILSFLCVSLAAVAVAFAQVPPAYMQDDEERTPQAQAVASGLKYLSIATAGTVLLLVGALLLGRYSLAMENTGLLQAGIALLAVGLLLRLGAMPFSPAYQDMAASLPAVSIVALGAGTASVLALGLLLLSPVQSSLHNAALLPWFGPLSALLAGLRALSASQLHDTHGAGSRGERGHSTLVAMSVALSLGWAISGVLSGSEDGTRGAVLVATNIAVAVPLLIVSWQISKQSPRLASAGTAVGVLSLLGLPPFGGAPGTFLLAQRVAGVSGIALGILLLASLLLASGWLLWLSHHATLDSPPAQRPPASGSWLTQPLSLLVCALIAAQPGLFFLR